MSTVISPSGAGYEQLPPPLPPESAQQSPDIATSDATVGQLISQVSEQASRLAREEMALARVEARRKVKVLGMGAGAFGLAAGLAFFGACCGIAAAVLGFANVLQPWLAAVLVAGLCFVLAVFIVLPGWRGITNTGVRPPDALQSVKDDVAAVRDAVRRR